MNGIIVWLKNMFFPPRCVLCDEVVLPEDLPVCPKCAKLTIPFIPQPTCVRCGRGKRDCVCKLDAFISDAVVAPFYNEQPIKDSIYRFKKVEDIDRLQYYSEHLLESIYTILGDKVVDYITTVPMHRLDYVKRGFDQIEPIAQYLSKELHVPYVPILHKLFRTEPQKNVPAHQRSGNLLGVFSVRTNRSLKGKNVLLLDDVITTGATTNECAKMLKIYGAKNVYVAAVAVSHPKKSEKDEQADSIAVLKEKLGGKVGDFT